MNATILDFHFASNHSVLRIYASVYISKPSVMKL